MPRVKGGGAGRGHRDVLGQVKEGPLGEPNLALHVRLKDAQDNLPDGWQMAQRFAEAEAAAFEERSLRKGVCPRCFTVRPCGIGRKRHVCDDDAPTLAMVQGWKHGAPKQGDAD